MSRLLLSMTTLSAACIADAPSAPRFQEDVMPILAANCIRCHGYPSIGGAPGDGDCRQADPDPVTWCGLRLDSYDDVIVDEGDPADPTDDVGVRGAAFVATVVPSRLRDPRRPMPPRFPLPDVALETLVAWSRGEPPDRTPRSDNVSPTLAIDDRGQTGGVVRLGYDLDDADRDLAMGVLRARRAGVDVLIGPIQSGRDELRWDTTELGAATYELVARIDDGAGWIELAAGTITVSAP